METIPPTPTPVPTPAPAPAARLTWVWIIITALVVGLLALVGVGLIRTQEGPITIGSKIPNFSLTTFDGQQLRFDDLRGKVIVLNFWASWCKPCEQEAAELEQAWRTYEPRGDVIFIGANYADTEPEALAYLSRFSITYPNGPDLGTRISQAFRIRGVPETYFIDKNGLLADVKIGPFLTLDEIIRRTDAVLSR